MRFRAVLDANIFASALMKSDGTPASVIRLVTENPSFELVLSEPIVQELERILFYPKIRKRIQKSDQEISLFLDAITLNSHFVTQQHGYDLLVPEDPDDDIYLIAALEGQARYLVSGDQHLLKIKQFEKIVILTASEFFSIAARVI